MILPNFVEIALCNGLGYGLDVALPVLAGHGADRLFAQDEAQLPLLITGQTNQVGHGARSDRVTLPHVASFADVVATGRVGKNIPRIGPAARRLVFLDHFELVHAHRLAGFINAGLLQPPLAVTLDNGRPLEDARPEFSRVPNSFPRLAVVLSLGQLIVDLGFHERHALLCLLDLRARYLRHGCLLALLVSDRPARLHGRPLVLERSNQLGHRGNFQPPIAIIHGHGNVSESSGRRLGLAADDVDNHPAAGGAIAFNRCLARSVVDHLPLCGRVKPIENVLILAPSAFNARGNPPLDGLLAGFEQAGRERLNGGTLGLALLVVGVFLLVDHQ